PSVAPTAIAVPVAPTPAVVGESLVFRSLLPFAQKLYSRQFAQSVCKIIIACTFLVHCNKTGCRRVRNPRPNYQSYQRLAGFEEASRTWYGSCESYDPKQRSAAAAMRYGSQP